MLALMLELLPLRYAWTARNCVGTSEQVLVNYYFNYALDIALLGFQSQYPTSTLRCKG